VKGFDEKRGGKEPQGAWGKGRRKRFFYFFFKKRFLRISTPESRGGERGRPAEGKRQKTKMRGSTTGLKARKRARRQGRGAGGGGGGRKIVPGKPEKTNGQRVYKA